jgi:phytoene synthase
LFPHAGVKRMTGSHAAASLGPFLRRHDPDRYLCTLRAPAAQRETLFTLYAFNHELARACEVASAPGLALIRLHWWREVVEGTAKPHEVATPLHEAVSDGRLTPAPLLAMIAARDIEAEGVPDEMADWLDWLHQGPGSLTLAAGLALGASQSHESRLRALGAGIGAAGQLRNILAFAAQGRCLLPRALLASHHLTPEGLVSNPGDPAFAPVRTSIAAAAHELLGAPQAWPRALFPAVLPAVLARRDLRGSAGRPHGLGDRIAVLLARRA